MDRIIKNPTFNCYLAIFLSEAIEASQCYFFEKKIDKTQMSKPPECAATFLKFFRSIYVGHLGLQSVTYRVETPCIC